MNTPLLLLHGALGSAAQFDRLRHKLPAAWPVFAPDFPGHDGLPADFPFSMDRFADSVLAFLDKNSLAQAHIFGYSMGGYVAFRLAWQYPERVRSIVTLGTKLAWDPETAARETALLNPEKIAAKVPAFAQVLAERYAPADWREVVRRTAGLLHDLGNGGALGEDAFRAIACPVLIGLGELDNMVTQEESRQVAEWLPHGRFEVLAGVKHPFEQVDASTLATWLQHGPLATGAQGT